MFAASPVRADPAWRSSVRQTAYADLDRDGTRDNIYVLPASDAAFCGELIATTGAQDTMLARLALPTGDHPCTAALHTARIGDTDVVIVESEQSEDNALYDVVTFARGTFRHAMRVRSADGTTSGMLATTEIQAHKRLPLVRTKTTYWRGAKGRLQKARTETSPWRCECSG